MATDQSEIELDARQNVDHFADRFNEWYGYGHVILASHAAFPVSVTVDLLYQLWANFKNYTDSIGQPRTIPMLAVSDLLLSTLFRQTGKDIYEMLPDTRAYLLNKLKNDPQFGEQRIQELAAFLYQYVQQISDTPESRNFKDNQKWTAYLAVDPALAVEKTLQMLAEQVGEGRMNDSLGLTNLLENFAKENNSFSSLLADHLKPTVTNGHPKTTSPSLLKKLVITNDADSAVSALNLPPHISNRFTGIKSISTAIKERIAGNEIKSTGYGLFIGLSEYKTKEMVLTSPAKEAKSVAECLVKNNLIEQNNCSIIVNESATKDHFQAVLVNILSIAKAEDFIIIYFSGHAKLDSKENMLVMYDYESESLPTGTISEKELNDWIFIYNVQDASIILILDTHSGSRKWLDEKNPKHISLMAGHMGEVVYEETSGGVFSNALIRSIKKSKGKITYRQLYAFVYLTIIEGNAFQCPLFIVNKESWDSYIFSNRRTNPVATTQMLLSDCKYQVKQDGIEGPETDEAIKRFFSEHKVEQREKLHHWLELKKNIQLTGSISLLILTNGVNSHAKSTFSNERKFRIKQKRYSLKENQSNNKKADDAFPHDKEKELVIAIASSDAIVLEYQPELTNTGFRIDPSVEKLLDVAFALDKELILYNENGISLPDELESRYQLIIWKNEYVAGVPESRLVPLHQFKEFLFKLLIINKDADTKIPKPLAGLLNEARTTKKLFLSDQKLQAIPEGVFALSKLEELYLEGNDISELPGAIGKLKKLRVLNLNGNSIKILPPEFLQLKNLQILALDNTNLEDLPYEIHKLTYLRELRVHGTQLVILPDSLTRLKYLEILDARENNILNVPRKFLNHKDAGRFRNYMRDLSPGKNKPILFLLGKDAKDTDGIADLIRKSSSLFHSQWIQETGIADTFSLYKVLKRGATDDCIVYISDKDGQLLKQFEGADIGKTIRNFEQFFKEIDIPHVNLFYDGFVPNVNEQFWQEIIQKAGLNTVLTQTEKVSGTWENFISEFFKNLLAWKPISESYSTAVSETGIKSKATSIPYMLYKASSFADITVTIRNSSVPIAGKKEKLKQRLEEAKETNSLDLSEFGFSEIPPEVFKLTGLESLRISKNKIKSIPQKIARLKNLKIFDGSKTLITSLPADFFHLTKLTKVIMDESSLEYLPSEISNLEQLNTLTFEKTLIKSLPPEISKLKKLKHIGALNNKIINVPEEILKDKKGDALRKYFTSPKSSKDRPVIIQLSSSSRSSVFLRFLEGSSETISRRSVLYNFVTKTNFKSLPDAFVFIKNNINNKALIIMDDNKGSLAYQFGKEIQEYYSTKQYFSSFGPPLNIIYNGPLNNQSALEDLVKEGKANSIIVLRDAPEKIEFPSVLSELMLRGGFSYRSAVLFIYKYFPRNVYSPPFVSSAKLGYDIFLNPKEFEDFYWVTEEEIKRSLPVEDIILNSKFISPSLAKRIMRELNAERTKGRSPSKRAQPNALSASKRTTKKTRQKSSAISKKSPAAKKKVAKKKVTPFRRPKKKMVKKK